MSPLTPNEVATQIYNLYPRKVAKRAAIRAIAHALTRIHDGEVNDKPMIWEDAYKYLITKVRQYADSPAGNRGEFTPHPATFFNQSRYLDHEIEWHRLTAAENSRSEATVGTSFSRPWQSALSQEEREQMQRRLV